MAQTGYTPILIYSSSTASQAPAAGNLTNSTLGSELAININDGKLFYKDSGGSVQVIGWKTVPTSAGGTGLTSYTAGDTLYYASGTTLSKLAIGSSGYYMSSSGTAPQWSAPAALTKTDDTNVTLTLGGSASTALLNAASLTLGWTGQLAASRGGTGIGTYTAGDLLYASGTTTLSKLAIGTANYVLTSSGSAPQWTVGSSVSVGTASNLLSNATTGVMQIVGPAASTTRVMTIPNANFTAARTDAAQTFTGTQTFSQINTTAGYQFRGADDTSYELLRYVGGTNNPGIFIKVTESTKNVGIFSSGSSIGGQIFKLGVEAVEDVLSIAYSGASAGVTFKYNNLIQGTAAKGINFTANTGAAGMTSQLLNWYEEGTWTPTITAQTGTFTTVSATGEYTRVGRQVTIHLKITITSVGTASGYIKYTLPFTAQSKSYIGAAMELATVGLTGFTYVYNTDGYVYLYNYTGTVIGANYAWDVSVTYFV